ncbi:DNA methylase N-4/N-6 domain protein [Planktothrix sp. PCC 11201]|uniref:DNA methyltransferase n=1 Tax=Planktothrix sp. PCC 11201 TaxID=1729650 RepID=UPI0009211E44|nr:DNA methyltransferase [Planktothrix sp. PCC 11201]SKB12210.1 DNA methylase N-4/N-6 domain protein [Planktothrix sp. PCC 11201]
MVNQLFYGDNLEVLRKYIKDESVDLCYIDPPFNSKRNYNQIYNNLGKEDQAQAFIDTWTWDDQANQGLEDIFSNYQGHFTQQSIDLIAGLTKVLGKGSLLAYLVSITLRIVEIYRVLKPTGSFYLHCDPTSSHYLKLVLDAFFFPQGGDFLNEIVWCYRGGGYPKQDFGRRHDVILRYSKSNKYLFNPDSIRIPYQAEGINRKDDAMWGKHKGTDKVYKPHPLGKIPEDWWLMNILNANDPERLGYPTQKPEALLERIIQASSNKDDVVLDAYCGCGTTVAVSQRLDRQWIGIDITYQSISLILKRLEDAFGQGVLEQIQLNGIPKDMKSAIALANKKDDRTRKEFEKWAVLTYSNNRAIINHKKGSDKGIDGIAYFRSEQDEPEKIILQVKSGNIKSGDIRDLQGTLTLEKAAMGIFITLKEPTKEMIKTAKSAGIYQNKYMSQSSDIISIVTIQEIIEDQKRLSIPLGYEVLKSAEKQKEVKATQLKLDIDFNY